MSTALTKISELTQKIFKLTQEISKLVEIDNMAYNYSSTPILYPQNIQKILLGLDLGENPEYIKPSFTSWFFDDEITDEDRLSSYRRGLKEGRNNSTKTQVKALSDKWFSLREENDQAVSSLWDSSKGGQVEVLEELLEVLKGINK